MKDTIITKDWNEFACADSFNNNFVEGYISRHNGDDYGSLFIEKVNGDKCSQLIYCTPKIAYPFDKCGNWHWPKAKVIERYEKLDGTNVFAYRYHDAKGNGYLSFKTRLLPFLQQSRFGPFLEMWKEILTKYPIIAKLPWFLNMNLSFELWGARNPHLVKYDVPLTTSLLFARNGDAIMPPSQLKHESVNELQAPLRGKVEGDYVWNYETAQDGLEKGLKEVEDGYAGVEGEVWYLQDVTGRWILFKCKPETIEMIHWASGGIGKNVLRATIENAFENWDEPTVEQIKQLLLEEFSEAEVEKSHYRIGPIPDKAKAEHILREEVLKAYSEIGVSILDDKATVMRALSQQFDKKDMRRVFTTIWNKEVK